MIKLFKSVAVPLAFGMLTASLPVYADEPDILISIDQKEISLEQLQEANYEVPVFIRLSQNVELNAIEFGLEVDNRCRFEIVTKNAYSQLYGEELGINMVAASGSGIDGYAWMTWMQQAVYSESQSNLVMLLVTVPESAAPGDVFPIRYLTVSHSNPNKQHIWFNFIQNTDYAQSGTFQADDGFIEIAGGEYTPGDVTQDGKIDILDVITINRSIVGKESLTPIQKKAADMDGDGIPSATDSMTIMRMIVGLI